MNRILTACIVWLGACVLATDELPMSSDPHAGLLRTASAAEEAGPMRFKRFSYVDREGIGIEAFSLLVPQDWQFSGGIHWILDNPGMPARSAFTVRSPDGSEELEVFPNQPFFWTDNQLVLSALPAGARYFGCEVRPPCAGPLEALRGIVLPRFRGKAAGLKVVSQEVLPDLARALGAGSGSQPGVVNSASAGKVRIEYTRKGLPTEEEIYGVVETVSFPVQTMSGVRTSTFWYANYLFSFKAPKGKLDSRAKVFQTMTSSFRVDPQWFNKYNQLVLSLIRQQIRQIQSIGQLSRMISQTHDQISQEMLDSYNQRQQVYDRLSDNFSRHIRGVDEYYDPIEQKNVELPSGYTNVWTNPLGEYVLTDDPNFNPGVGSNLHWERIEKTR
ncbi:MAG: hypothetical protein AB1640_08830 [bacterium]